MKSLKNTLYKQHRKSIQQAVSRKENGQWCSDLLPGQFFDSKEAAEAAEKGTDTQSLKRSGEDAFLQLINYLGASQKYSFEARPEEFNPW